MEKKMKEGESRCGTKLCFYGKPVAYNARMKEIERCKSVQWLLSDSTNCKLSQSREMLSTWCETGTRKTTIEDETNFCEPAVLRQVLHAKSMFDKATKREMSLARAQSNPFETINKSIFINRAAVKFAALLDYHLTNPKDVNGKSLVDDVFNFCDICAGPGGFSEYILWRKGWQAKGFGFTLRGPDDFTLNKSAVASCETFQAYYGCHNDGNLLEPNNIKSLCDFVLKRTENNGVHLLMADGGFRVDDHNIQEIESKQLILCQFVTVLGLVREGGTCVVKMFDVFTPFTAGLVYLMYKCFKQIAIVKPDASRPANSERYLIGKFKKANTDNIKKYLFAINEQMTNNQDVDVLELVPINIMKGDNDFFAYLHNSNNTIGRKQVDSLLKMAAFYNKDNFIVNNKHHFEEQQRQMRYDCLVSWNLPLQQVIMKEKSLPELLGSTSRDVLSISDRMVSNEAAVKTLLTTRGKCCFVPIGTAAGVVENLRTFFLCTGGNKILYFSTKGFWEVLEKDRIVLQLCRDSLFYGELVNEFAEGGSVCIPSLHIIDAIRLGGQDVSELSLQERHHHCKVFAMAHNNQITSMIRCKPMHQMENYTQFRQRFTHYPVKAAPNALALKMQHSMGGERLYIPQGILVLEYVKPNLERVQSVVGKADYFQNSVNFAQLFPHMDEHYRKIYASFEESFRGKVLFKWQGRDLLLQPTIKSVKPSVSDHLVPKLVKSPIKSTVDAAMQIPQRVQQCHIVQKAGGVNLRDQHGNLDRNILHYNKRVCTESKQESIEK